jgi:VWFA-related protein
MGNRRHFLFATASLLAQEQPVRFAAGAREVRLDVSVANSKGPVEGLDARDFVVTDEDRPVELTYGGLGQQPLQIMLLLDVSGSMKRYLEQVAKNARQLIGLLREEDRAAVMVFTKETDYLRPFTNSQEKLVYALDQAMRPHTMPAGTAINHALLDAAEAFQESKMTEAYRAVVILTDNRGLNYQSPDSPVIEKFYAADVVLHSVLTKNAQIPKVVQGANQDFSFANVTGISDATGGEIVRTDKADEAFSTLLKNARRRYLLTFRPAESPEKQYRKLSVNLTKDALKRVGKVAIRARAGYYTAG